MPLDGAAIAAIASEIDSTAIESRVSKIYQPTAHEIILHLHKQQEKMTLLISAHPQNARVHFVKELKENPMKAPQFSMTLRKHLQGAKLIHVEQPTFERMLVFTFSAYDELGDPTEKNLIVEMMGKHSNIILVHDGTIIDSIVRVSHNKSRLRLVLPGQAYHMPPTTKKDPFGAFFDDFKESIHSSNSYSKALVNHYNGISPVMAEHIMGGHEDSSLTVEALFESWQDFLQMIQNKQFVFCLFHNSGTGKPDFSVIPLCVYDDDYDTFPSMSSLLITFYQDRESANWMHQKKENIKKIATEALKKVWHTMEKQELAVEANQHFADKQLYGELLTAYAYDIEAGIKEYRAKNYYNDEWVFIPMAPTKTAIENAQKYFKRYEKDKRVFTGAREQLQKNDMERAYLEQLILSIDWAETDSDLEEMRDELVAGNYISTRKQTGKKKTPASLPHHYRSSDGFDIFVGRNNKQNEHITKNAQKSDIWLHVKDLPGSHTVIRTENKEIPSSTLMEAALLAAYYSRGRDASKISVDYTEIKHVKKPSSAPLGYVHYTDFQTIIVSPMKESIEKILIMKEASL